MPDITIGPVSPDNENLIHAIIRLADSNRRTLGFLPPAVFYDATAKGLLLAAMDADKLLGYALYGLPKNEVRLTHLVVANSNRGNGIARKLVEHIAMLHSDRQGVRVKCRRDYGLDGMWLKLGFQPLNEVPGRGQDRKPLVVWYRTHPGHVDLFTYKEQPMVRAAIDFNILRDLYDLPVRKGAEESHSLIADHLDGLLELVVTAALQNEVSAIQNDQRRSLYRRKIHANHSYAPPETKNLTHCTNNLISRVQQEHLNYPSSKQDKADVEHVAAAAAAGLTIFATRDEALIEKCGKAALEEFDLRILRPADVVIRIDELIRADAYRPATLQGTGYSTASIASSGEGELLEFRNSEKSERNVDFLRKLRKHSSEGHDAWERILTRDPDQKPVGILVYGLHNGRLEVPLFRVLPKHSLATTLVHQMLTELRRRCVNFSASIIAITDDAVSDLVRRAALFDGFFETSEALFGLAIKHCGTVNEIREIGESHLQQWDIAWQFPSSLNLSAISISELESILWPAKIIDGRVPCFMIPVQPRWSMDLFGVPETLPFSRPDELGISREHVYYRSPNGPRINAPARILWYMSQGKGVHRREAAIIASSLLEEVVVGSPPALHERFKHLGVFELSHIEEVAKAGRVQALRFTHTEIFSKPLAGKNLSSFLREWRFKLPLLSARAIRSDLFIAAYQIGLP